MKDIYFECGLKITTKFPEKFVDKKNGWTMLGDGKAIFDFTGMKKGSSFVMRAGKHKFVRIIRA